MAGPSRERKGRSRRRASRGAQRERDLATDPGRVKRDGRWAFNLARLHGSNHEEVEAQEGQVSRREIKRFPMVRPISAKKKAL